MAVANCSHGDGTRQDARELDQRASQLGTGRVQFFATGEISPMADE